MAGELLHATAISSGGRAALIRGPSGSGKSDLALRCLALAPNPFVCEPARLLCDDQVLIERNGQHLMAVCPPSISGKLEIRGLGILESVPAEPQPVRVALIVDLSSSTIDRFPDPWPHAAILGVAVPLLILNPFEPSSALKLMIALTSPKLPLGG